MRIVVDTNVLASAVYFGGKPFKLLKLIMEEQISAIASKEIVEEYEEILVRLQQKLISKVKQVHPVSRYSWKADCNKCLIRHSYMPGSG